MRAYVIFFPSRERERPVLNPALALGARISGAGLHTANELRARILLDAINETEFNRVKTPR